MVPSVGIEPTLPWRVGLVRMDARKEVPCRMAGRDPATVVVTRALKV